ncbi:MAG: nucleoside monophosphate kinase [Elusimicrobiota bacterium]|nr:nucleoside monophosphate kinase [Endomicrobiia bacterium]MDW8165490.1 nucleoside monophosphate kinase [Elusimicrobiota bacterium]
MKTKIIFLGPPGSGKGTQAQMVSKDLGLNHISPGEIFRRIIKENNPAEIAEKIKFYVQSGLLVPDEIVFEAIKLVLDKKNFLLDGFPRNLNQAKLLEEFLDGELLDVVIYFNISDEEIIKRLSSRRSCPKCGRIYNILTLRPKKENLCDDCEVELIIREDDKIETIKKRIEVYKKETASLIDYYKKILIDVDATESIESLTNKIKSIILS